MEDDKARLRELLHISKNINVTFSDVSIKWDSGAVDSWVEKGTA